MSVDELTRLSFDSDLQSYDRDVLLCCAVDRGHETVGVSDRFDEHRDHTGGGLIERVIHVVGDRRGHLLTR